MLRGLRPRIPRSLIAGPGWDRLLHRVGGLPAAAAASACGFELRLGDTDPAADFSVAVAPGPVAQYYVAHGAGAAPASAEGWLSRHLADKSGPDDWIDHVLLAYDIIDAPSGRQGAPAVCLPIPAQLPGRGPLSPDRLAGALRRAAGWTQDDLQRRALTRAFEALPSGAAVVFAAVNPERTPMSSRLVVAGVSAPRVGSFLERLAWTGSMPTIRRVLSGMQDVSDRFMLAFDVTANGALPRLGLEMYPAYPSGADYHALLSTWLRTTASDWRSLLDRLVDMGLCLPVKAGGLLSWPRRNNLFGNGQAFRLHMGINHVKITVIEERMQAKAYAGLRLLPLEPIPPGNVPAGSA